MFIPEPVIDAAFNEYDSTQVWDILIKNEENQLVCLSRLTMAVLKNKE